MSSQRSAMPTQRLGDPLGKENMKALRSLGYVA